jgi:hypothetical protein
MLRTRAVPFGLAVAVALSGCSSSSGTPTAYEKKAADAAAEVVSATRTVLFVAQAGAAGGTFAPTAAVTIEDAERDAAWARDSFAADQPPDASSDRLRAEILPELERAVDQIEKVRIEARRGGIAQLGQVAAPLQDLASRLDAFASSYG